MELAQIESVAGEIIAATAPLVGGHTINIMDTAGVIIASSDPARVGTFHRGAAEVLKTRAPVRITRADLPRYEGAREGVNLPILNGGKLLGVVGILGNPDEVENAANLLGVCVGLYLKQAAATRRDLLRKELREGLLRQLLAGGTDADALFKSENALSIEQWLPARAVAILPKEQEPLRRARLLNRMEERLTARGFADAKHELYGVAGDALLLLRHTTAGFRAAEFSEQLRDCLEKECGEPFSIAIGGQAHTLPALAASCREARLLAGLTEGCADLEQSHDRLLYLMGTIPRETLRRVVAPLYDAVCDGFGDDAIETIEAYCDCDFSIAKASLQLHIHKNTLLYRIKKMLGLMGLEDAQGFVKWYHLKLLTIYHQLKKENRI